MARQTSEGTACGSMCFQSQHGAPSCPCQCASHHILGVAPRVFLSADLHEESGCLPHCGPSQMCHKKSCSSQPGATGNPSNRNLRRIWQWPSERLDPGIKSPGLENWPKDEQKQGRELLTRSQHLFACSDLHLGKTSLIKHRIELPDQMPFKECYWKIPPKV